MDCRTLEKMMIYRGEVLKVHPGRLFCLYKHSSDASRLLQESRLISEACYHMQEVVSPPIELRPQAVAACSSLSIC